MRKPLVWVRDQGPSAERKRREMVTTQQARRGRRAQSNTPRANTPSRISLGWSPFHTAARDYFQAGYLPIPLPEGKKFPPPKGVPNDVEYNERQLGQWLKGIYEGRDKPDLRYKNIGCIVPDDVVVIDVDGPAARETLVEMEEQYGALPPTWMSFRGDP